MFSAREWRRGCGIVSAWGRLRLVAIPRIVAIPLLCYRLPQLLHNVSRRLCVDYRLGSPPCELEHRCCASSRGEYRFLVRASMPYGGDSLWHHLPEPGSEPWRATRRWSLRPWLALVAGDGRLGASGRRDPTCDPPIWQARHPRFAAARGCDRRARWPALPPPLPCASRARICGPGLCGNRRVHCFFGWGLLPFVAVKSPSESEKAAHL